MNPKRGAHALNNLRAFPTLLNPRRGPSRRRRRRTRVAVAVALALLTLVLVPLCAPRPSAQGQGVSGPAARPLPTGVAAEYEIDSSERHPYTVALAAGEFVQVRVERMGADVNLLLTNAAGEEVALMGGVSALGGGGHGGLTLSYAAAEAGAYKLEVIAHAKATRGRYSIRRTAARPATAADRRRVEVERTFAEGLRASDTRGKAAAENAIAKFTETLAGWQELSDAEMVAVTRRAIINQKGRAAFSEGRTLTSKGTPEDSRKAIPKFIETARLYHEAEDVYGEAAGWFGAAMNSEGFPDPAATAEFYRRAAPLFLQAGDKPLAANLLRKVGAYSYISGDFATALQAMLTALQIFNEIQLLAEAAEAESDLGALYGEFGDYENALKYLNASRAHREGLSNKCAMPTTLTNLAYVYSAMGFKAKALNLLEKQAWPLYKAEGDCATDKQYEPAGDCAAERAATLINIGKVYYDLGDNRSAQCYYKGAAALVKNESYEAARLNNVGAAHYAAGMYKEALDVYKRALDIYERLKDVRNVATTQTNVAAVRAALGEREPALHLLEQTLLLRREVSDRAGEAITLNGIGEVHMQAGDSRAALDYFKRALPLFAATGERNLEAGALVNAMRASRALGNRGAAIFYGKQAVNRYQELRGASRELKGELQKNYLRTVTSAYQQLAELLVEAGLAVQAVQVLDFYQDQQFFDLSTGPRAAPQRVEFSQQEKPYETAYEAAAKRLAEVAPLLRARERRARSLPPTDEEAAELQAVTSQFTDAAAALTGVLKEVASGLTQSPDAQEVKDVPDEVSRVFKALGTLDSKAGQKTAVLYTVVGDERLYVLLVGPNGVSAFTRAVGASDVERRVSAFLEALRCPESDPRRAGAELYDAIFGATAAVGGARATLAAALSGRKPDVLLWSLDGPLRNIPVAALYDAEAKQYLVEKYQSAVFTRSGAENLLRAPKLWTSGIGLGTSKAYTGFTPLKWVPFELRAIFGGARGAGPRLVSGPVRLNENFTRKTLDNLNGMWPLVHIASHFRFEPGDSYSSMLLLGDNDYYRLFEMQEKRDLFKGVELLMLSACETGTQRTDLFFRKDIDGFAELAQRQGASSVIATLWRIDDSAAPSLVVGFYRLHAAHPHWPKSELLRQAQLSLLKGKGMPARGADLAARGQEEESCADDVEGAARFVPEAGAPLAHPFYWAPFVLYGGAR